MSSPNRYTMDDMGIGPLDRTGSCIAQHAEEYSVDRPPGLTQLDWYKFAGRVCDLLNMERDAKKP